MAGCLREQMSTPATTELHVNGMTCQNCARHVTEAIQSVPGVRSALVSLEKKSASVRWNADSPKDVAAVIAAVQKAGYEAKAIQAAAGGHSASKHADWQITLWLGLAVTAVLMIGEWVFGLAMTPWFQWLAFALAGVVQIFCGAQFYRGAWRQLQVGSSNMDTLVALGSTTAFGFSCWVLFSGQGGHGYFMEAAAIISLISAGHWIEARVSEKAGGALKALLNLAPQTARRRNRPASAACSWRMTPSLRACCSRTTSPTARASTTKRCWTSTKTTTKRASSCASTTPRNGSIRCRSVATSSKRTEPARVTREAMQNAIGMRFSCACVVTTPWKCVDSGRAGRVVSLMLGFWAF